MCWLSYADPNVSSGSGVSTKCIHPLSGSCWKQQSRGCLGRSPGRHTPSCTRSGDQLVLLLCFVCKSGSCYVASVTLNLAMQTRTALSFQEAAYLYLPECWDYKHALSCPARNNFMEINIPDHRYSLLHDNPVSRTSNMCFEIKRSTEILFWLFSIGQFLCKTKFDYTFALYLKTILRLFES